MLDVCSECTRHLNLICAFPLTWGFSLRGEIKQTRNCHGGVRRWLQWPTSYASSVEKKTKRQIPGDKARLRAIKMTLVWFWMRSIYRPTHAGSLASLFRRRFCEAAYTSRCTVWLWRHNRNHSVNWTRRTQQPYITVLHQASVRNFIHASFFHHKWNLGHIWSYAHMRNNGRRNIFSWKFCVVFSFCHVMTFCFSAFTYQLRAYGYENECDYCVHTNTIKQITSHLAAMRNLKQCQVSFGWSRRKFENDVHFSLLPSDGNAFREWWRKRALASTLKQITILLCRLTQSTTSCKIPWSSVREIRL